jgi:hypothetical protein
MAILRRINIPTASIKIPARIAAWTTHGIADSSGV